MEIYTPVLGSEGFIQHKLITTAPGESSGALYDLTADIGETTNLIEAEPDVVEKLHTKLEEITGQQF